MFLFLLFLFCFFLFVPEKHSTEDSLNVKHVGCTKDVLSLIMLISSFFTYFFFNSLVIFALLSTVHPFLYEIGAHQNIPDD